MTKQNSKSVKIIGGGLAGCEAAFYLLKHGFNVTMYEMRPNVETGAHVTDKLAEIVCSNSLKSEGYTASGLLKAELDLLGATLLSIARENRVPSGSALSVDREKFSDAVQNELLKYNNFKLIREEVVDVDDNELTIIATGPLTSPKMVETISRITNSQGLHFYDAIAPIVEFSSIDMNKAYFGGRYDDNCDYLNLPMNRDEYELFYRELISAEQVTLRNFEKRELFDGCMPIEEMAKRGSDTIRFGPLKPIGLKNPKDDSRAYAVVQLRKENVEGDCYNMVGFQTNLKYSEQKRVFSLIPALHDAEFLRYGIMHRNTYIDAPKILNNEFKVKDRNNLYIAGQLSGVEGYVESMMSGLIVAISIVRRSQGLEPLDLPRTTITGALTRYIQKEDENFNPMNANFGILPGIDKSNKVARKQLYYERGVEDLKIYLEKIK